jgi:hypothetical protein
MSTEPRPRVSDEDLESLEQAAAFGDFGTCGEGIGDVIIELRALREVAAAARDAYEATVIEREEALAELGEALTKAGY